MATLAGPYYVIRHIGTNTFVAASGTYATPKLYKAGSAKSVLTMYNNRGHTQGPQGQYEMIEVEVRLLDNLSPQPTGV